jgi:hypothetical protein
LGADQRGCSNSERIAAGASHRRVRIVCGAPKLSGAK